MAIVSPDIGYIADPASFKRYNAPPRDLLENVKHLENRMAAPRYVSNRLISAHILVGLAQGTNALPVDISSLPTLLPDSR